MTQNINKYPNGTYWYLKQSVEALKANKKGSTARKIAKLLEKHLDDEEDDGG